MLRRRQIAAHRFWAIIVIPALVFIGCSTRQSADQALESALKTSGQQKSAVYPLAGRVLIDGEAPHLANGERIVVMLNDSTQPDVALPQRKRVVCGSQGEFAFQTYTPNDGVPPGKYVITLAQLKFNKKRGFRGPDGLKNLYNDPDKNAQDHEFTIDHQAPGKSDYVFNLQIAGKEAGTAGPHALTQILEK